MDSRGAPRMVRYLPQALAATSFVVVLPAVAVWLLRSSGTIGSELLGATVGIALSLSGSLLGGLYWTHLARTEGVLFSDLMIWGWVRRWRAERRLTEAMTELSATAARAAEHATGDHEDPVWAAESRMRLLSQLAEALEAGDPYTRGHSRRVARYAVMIAERMGVASDRVRLIRTAALLHDVGKISTPLTILHKPDPLSGEEFWTVKLHPVDGARLVAALGDPALTEMVLHHHERLDGRGYPERLSGERIPLGARIIAVADTFDAITSARPYRPAGHHERALGILDREAGTQFDPDAVAAFRACYSDRRSLAVWAVVTSVPERITSWLGSANPAAAATLSKALAAASAVAVAGGTAAAIAAPLRVTGRLTAPGSPALGASTSTTGGSGTTGVSDATGQGASSAGGAGAATFARAFTAVAASPLRAMPAWSASGSGPIVNTAEASPTTTATGTNTGGSVSAIPQVPTLLAGGGSTTGNGPSSTGVAASGGIAGANRNDNSGASPGRSGDALKRTAAGSPNPNGNGNGASGGNPSDSGNTSGNTSDNAGGAGAAGGASSSGTNAGAGGSGSPSGSGSASASDSTGAGAIGSGSVSGGGSSQGAATGSGASNATVGGTGSAAQSQTVSTNSMSAGQSTASGADPAGTGAVNGGTPRGHGPAGGS